jgi:hypothetical protein
MTAAVRPRRAARRAGQLVDVPERVYRGAHYWDVTVAMWTKTAALDLDHNGTDHCHAGVAQLAAFVGLSLRHAERALWQMRRPGPDGAGPELEETVRRTYSGGTGRTATRAVRPVLTGEPFLPVPVLAADALSPREFRAYVMLRHARAHGLDWTEAELAGELFHHHGARAGDPVSVRTASRLIDRLEALGWITLERRAGRQGRHLLAAVHDHPLHHAPGPVDSLPPAPPLDTETAAAPVNHGGSGSTSHGGSLAIFEDSEVGTDGVAQVGDGSSAVGDLPVVGPAPVDNPPPATPRSLAPPPRTGSSAAADRTADGPVTLLPGPVRTALQPVADLLPRLSRWERREVMLRTAGAVATRPAGAVARQLEARRARLDGPIRQPGRWILGAGLARWGCQLQDCVDGTLYRRWAPGTAIPCEACGQIAAARRRQARINAGACPTCADHHCLHAEFRRSRNHAGPAPPDTAAM